MAPVDIEALLEGEKKEYKEFSAWLTQVDLHRVRDADFVKPILDAFWQGGARVPSDLIGFTQAGIGSLPDPPQHVKAAFAWRAVSSAERAAAVQRPPLQSPGQTSSSLPAAPVILSSDSSMNAQSLADALTGQTTPTTSSSALLDKLNEACCAAV